jgi:HEAT repeat protein
VNISSTFKNLIIATVVVAMVVVVFLVHALAGLSARPVVFADPPAFVERYAAEMDHSDPSSLPKETETNDGNVNESASAKLTADLSNEEVFVLNVILYGNSLDMLLRLFTHPDKAQRVKIASAFAAVNVKFSHHEESGFAKKRSQFQLDVKEHLTDIQNALSEALIASAEQGTVTYNPYTLAWLPGQGRETVELLAWAAKHHPDPGVRRSSVYFVVKLGGGEELAGPLLQNRSHDPDYSVRRLALDLRFRRFTGEL